jgi:hypothetical protein
MIKPRDANHLLVCALATGALLAADVSVRAQSFNYTNCDLVAGFHVIGGASD